MSLLNNRRWVFPARPDFYVQTGSMFENPYGVPVDEILRMILNTPPEVVAQVVFGKYVESSGLVFSGDLVQMLFNEGGDPVRSGTYVDEEAMKQAPVWAKQYGGWSDGWFSSGIDFGRQTDFTVITTLDTRTLPARVVYYKRLNRVPWDSIFAEVGRAIYLFGPHVLFDSTGPAGDVIGDSLLSKVYCPAHHRVFDINIGNCMVNGKELDGCKPDLFTSLASCEGYAFGAQSKKELIEHLRKCMADGYTPDEEFGLIRAPRIPELEEELSFYAWDDKKLSTDCVMSLALAAWAGLEERLGEALLGSPFGRDRF